MTTSVVNKETFPILSSKPKKHPPPLPTSRGLGERGEPTMWRRAQKWD